MAAGLEAQGLCAGVGVRLSAGDGIGGARRVGAALRERRQHHMVDDLRLYMAHGCDDAHGTALQIAWIPLTHFET